jgi:cell division transport system permease protein
MVSRSDGLGLRRALSDRLLPGLVAAMTFLAALALAGAVGASLLAARWSSGAASVLTVQVPRGDDPPEAASGSSGTQPASRIDAVMALLAAEPSLAEIRRLDRAALTRLLSPWLGEDAGAIALPLPAVVQLRRLPGRAVTPDLAARLDRVAPGTLLERNGTWSDRLVALTTSLQACAGVALLVVAGVAVAVVAAATRAGLAARRQAIEIVHGLGATDSYIAGRFAGRATGLAMLGGTVGTLLSVPLLLTLCHLAAPFASPAGPAEGPAPDPDASRLGVGMLVQMLARVPLPLWIALPLLPLVAATIGWGTAQATVRTWLRRLP